MIFENELGKIEFRTPNILEVLRMSDKYDFSALASGGKVNSKVADLLEEITPYIIKVDLVLNGVKVETYKEMLDNLEFMATASGLLEKFFSGLNLDTKKKD